MKFATAALILLASADAYAERPAIWVVPQASEPQAQAFSPSHPDFRNLAPVPRVKGAKLAAAPARTTISNVIYINNCMPNGCQVKPGNDDARTNQSSIVERPVTLSAWPHGDAQWRKLVQCMEDTYSLFNIKIVTEDPGSTNHSEVIFGGKSTDFDPEFQAGGVAPFLSCGATEDNGLSFVFAAQTANLDFLCWAGVQESAHVFGLDHELESKDPLTYLFPPYHKEFQSVDAPCGEVRGEPRECFCGGNTQNTVKYLTDVFGPGTPKPPTLAITRPRNGAWVRPGFPLEAQTGGRFLVDRVDLLYKGEKVSALDKGPFIFNTPEDLVGEQTFKVMAAGAETTLEEAVTVTVASKCTGSSDCSGKTVCAEGLCIPNAKVAGGLGATCETDNDCVLGSCATDGDVKVCSATCSEELSCPRGFDCLPTAGRSLCWPNGADDDDGGCQSSSSPNPAGLLLSVGMVAWFARRRRPNRR